MKTTTLFFWFIILASFMSVTTPPATWRVSLSRLGEEGNGNSYYPVLSDDGRYVVFASYATNLVPNDTNNTWDVFVHDQSNGETERVSLTTEGIEGDYSSNYPDISADGRYVVFFSYATNLVPNDNNGQPDIFLHDRETNTTEIISVTSDEQPMYTYSTSPKISPDGRFVVFDSTPGVYVRDRLLGITERVDVDDAGQPGNSYSGTAHISADGRYVTFYSRASDLVPNDLNGSINDVFLRDRQLQTTRLISLGNDGQPGNGNSTPSDISRDGRFIVFSSLATNFASGDSFNTIDLFMYDSFVNQLQLISATPFGYPGNGTSSQGVISSDNRLIAFQSGASNLVANDTNGEADIFVYDLHTRFFYLASINGVGEQGDDNSLWPAVTPDGFIIAFGSEATNLVADDTNNKTDIFVHQWQLYTTYLPIAASP